MASTPEVIMSTIHAIQRLASPGLDRLMLAITGLGSAPVYIGLLIIAYLAVDAASVRRIAVLFLLSIYLNQQLKVLFSTPRPFQLDDGVARSPAAMATAGGAGFPSGHAQLSTTFWGLVAFYTRRRSVTLLAVALVGLISFSRLYLGLHFPIDVVGGILIGLLFVALGAWTKGRIPEFTVGPLLVIGLGIPLSLQLLFPTPESALVLGGLAAFIVGPTLVPYHNDAPWWGRLLLTGMGLLLAFAFLFITDAILPAALADHPLGGFVRYFLLGSIITTLVPFLGRLLNLFPRLERRADGP